eukprot:TRINITY_DN64347_c0_g1_i1.p1 TRINITY_DN64347_c0_g1~~TRINITY_DN64347_c0_g1_i1.p1  ORF type:complete len:190 (+),score=36.74 TRINITY_DN64347_c0_g1_i1:99-668(+)
MTPMAKPASSAGDSDTLYIVCLLHLIVCVMILWGTTPGDRSFSIGGVLIAPEIQWLNGAFTCISIVVLICAAVGNLYLIEGHLAAYLLVLAVGIVLDLIWFAAFLLYGESCPVTHGGADHISATVSCSMSAGAVLVCLALLLIFKVWAAWATSKAKRVVRIKYNEALMPFLQKSLNSSLGEGMNFGAVQ